MSLPQPQMPVAISFYVFAIRDQKTDSFMTPFFQTHKPAALRMFSDLVNDPNAPISKHPDDYSLHCLGTFDTGSGNLNPIAVEHLAYATDFIPKM